jgi:hypothetical protein
LVGIATDEPNFTLHVGKFDLTSHERIDDALYQGFARFRGQVDSPDPVPEPATLLLVATGVGAIGRRAWKRQRKQPT